MYLKHLKLYNFRNYNDIRLDFKKSKTVIVGGNAQGKTNLVEAIYFLATLDSPRTSVDAEYVRWGEASCLISGLVTSTSGTEAELEVIISPGKQKTLKINKVKKTSHSQFLGNMVAVSFSVDDLLLLRGAPKDRRKWIDTAICQIYPGYYNRMQTYNKVRDQKKAFLKTLYGHYDNMSSMQKSMLESWNDQIAIAGSNIVYLREKFLKELYPCANLKNHQISDSKDDLTISYNTSLDTSFCCHESNLPSVEEIKNTYLKALQRKEEEEVLKGQVLVGPHRDDITFYIAGKEANVFASQGQQRTIVLSLKLAELELLKNAMKEDPILILDDVLAELDLVRQKHLFESISQENQTIITTTDLEGLKDKWFDDIDIIEVNKGNIVYEKV